MLSLSLYSIQSWAAKGRPYQMRLPTLHLRWSRTWSLRVYTGKYQLRRAPLKNLWAKSRDWILFSRRFLLSSWTPNQRDSFPTDAGSRKALPDSYTLEESRRMVFTFRYCDKAVSCKRRWVQRLLRPRKTQIRWIRTAYRLTRQTCHTNRSFNIHHSQLSFSPTNIWKKPYERSSKWRPPIVLQC